MRRDVRCLQTGQNHPFAFLFLRVFVVGTTVGIGVGIWAASGAALAAVVSVPSSAAAAAAASALFAALPSVAVVAAAAGAGTGVTAAGGSFDCTICPPAPNSIMLMAHSRQATKCLQGRRTTSRGAERQSRHSEDGSSSKVLPGVAVGG